MNNENKESFAGMLSASLRCWAATLAVCCVCYPAIILAAGQLFAPYTANGSLITNDDGKIIGSKMLAQKFEKPRYFHSRPSAANYDPMKAGGSNLSPANPAIAMRAQKIINNEGGSKENPVPSDMLTASGSGLDPHITAKAAYFQAERVAKARNMPVAKVKGLIEKHAFQPRGIFGGEPLVNVLLLNIEMDKTGGRP